LVNLTRSFKRK